MKKHIIIVHMYIGISILGAILFPWLPHAYNYSLFSSVFYSFLYAISTEVLLFKVISLVWIFVFTTSLIVGYVKFIRNKHIEPVLIICVVDFLASVWAVIFKLQIDNYFGFHDLVVGSIFRLICTSLLLWHYRKMQAV